MIAMTLIPFAAMGLADGMGARLRVSQALHRPPMPYRSLRRGHAKPMTRLRTQDKEDPGVRKTLTMTQPPDLPVGDPFHF